MPLPSPLPQISLQSVGWLVVHHKYAGETVTFICAALLLSRATVYRIMSNFKKYSDVRKPTERRGRRRKLNWRQVDVLRDLVETYPDRFLDEYASMLSRKLGIGVNKGCVARYLQRDLGITHKKVRSQSQSQSASLSSLLTQYHASCR